MILLRCVEAPTPEDATLIDAIIERHETPKRDGVPVLLTVTEAAAALRTGFTFAYESTGRHIAAPNPRDIPAIKVGRHTHSPRLRCASGSLSEG